MSTMVWGSAHQLARDLSSEKQQNLDAAWQRISAAFGAIALAHQSLGGSLRVAEALCSRCGQHHRQVPGAGRPPVTETDWTHARDDLSRALELAPGDKTLHAKIRLVDGHLARLRGTAEQDPRLLEDARQDFQAAATVDEEVA